MLQTAFSAVAASSLCVLTSTAALPVASDSAQFVLPEFDVANAAFSYAGDMDLDGKPGKLDMSRFELSTILSKPIVPIEGLSITPVFEYAATRLDFSGTPVSFPIGDEDLHSLAVSAYFISSCEGSPWIFGAWTRAQMATDFQAVDWDDLTFDVAAGAAYRFSPNFLLGVGAAVVNLNGDTTFYPGVGFDWIINDQVRMGIYGPLFVTAYKPTNDWEFTLRGEVAGDVWNIRDEDGKSHNIDLTSYRVGLFANRRLSGNLWLSVGGGATIGDEIRLTKPNGDRIDQQDLNSGLYGQIALRLRTW